MAPGPVVDTATADGWPFDDRDHQPHVEREPAMDADGDHTAAAEIAFVQREAGGQDVVAGATLILLADQPAAAVVDLPADSFLRWRSGGRGWPSDHARIEPMGARNARCADMLVSVNPVCWKTSRRQCLPLAAARSAKGGENAATRRRSRTHPALHQDQRLPERRRTCGRAEGRYYLRGRPSLHRR